MSSSQSSAESAPDGRWGGRDTGGAVMEGGRELQGGERGVELGGGAWGEAREGRRVEEERGSMGKPLGRMMELDLRDLETETPSLMRA